MGQTPGHPDLLCTYILPKATFHSFCGKIHCATGEAGAHPQGYLHVPQGPHLKGYLSCAGEGGIQGRNKPVFPVDTSTIWPNSGLSTWSKRDLLRSLANW